MRVSCETQEKIDIYLSELRRWSARVSLVSSGEVLVDRHVWDSLQLVAFIPSAAEGIVDLGSGGGFPGIALALATNIFVWLVEPDRRKAAFLSHTVRTLRLRAEPLVTRAGDVAIPLTDVLSARALASLAQLVSWAKPALKPGGIAIFPKGVSWRDEIAATRREGPFWIERFPSRTAQSSAILRLRNIGSSWLLTRTTP